MPPTVTTTTTLDRPAPPAPARSGAAAVDGLPAGARRGPRHRRRRRRAVPLRVRLDPRRVPRRRRLLRGERLPHHDADDRGVGAAPAASTAASSGCDGAGACCPPLYVMLLVVCTWAVLFVPDALDRLRSDVDRRPAVRHQLVVHRRRPELLRVARPAARPPAPLVAGRRGAVVPHLALRLRVRHAPRRRGRPPPRGAAARRGRGVGRLDGDPVRRHRRHQPRLLRHRHPPVGPADRRRGGHVLAAVAVADGRAAPPRRRRRRRRRRPRAPRRHDAALGIRHHLPLPRRVRGRRPAVDRGGGGRRPSRRPAPRRPAVGPAPALDRDALVRHLPVALARGRPPRRARRRLAPAGHGAAVDRAHGRAWPSSATASSSRRSATAR